MVPAAELKAAEVKASKPVVPAVEVVKPAEEKVYIPSIDDILARLDQEDEEERAMR